MEGGLSDAGALSGKHMGAHEVKGQPRDIPAERITLAFERLKLPTLVREIGSADADVRRNASEVLSRQLRSSEAAALLAHERGVKPVLDLLQDDDVHVRRSGADALASLACSAPGRRALFSFPAFLRQLQTAASDADDHVRSRFYDAAAELSSSDEGGLAMVATDAVELVLRRAREEDGERQGAALKVLSRLLAVVGGEAVSRALDTDAVALCTELLGSATASVRRFAAASLAGLTVSSAGKVAAVAYDSLARLVPVAAGDPAPSCQREACLAIANIAVRDEAKARCVELDVASHLFPLIDSRRASVRVNAIKALSCCVAHPDARAALVAMAAGDALEPLCDSDDVVEAAAARRLRELVLWKP